MTTDERLDELFRDWARAEVEGAGPATVERAEPVDILPVDRPAAAPARRARWMWLAAAAVVVLGLAGAGWAVLGAHDRPPTPSGPGTTATPPGTVKQLYGSWTEPVSKQTIAFKPGSFSISVLEGCYASSGYVLHVLGDRLSITEGQEMASACVDVIAPYPADRVAAYVRLRKVVLGSPTWHVSGSRLELTAPDGTRVVLTRVR